MRVYSRLRALSVRDLLLLPSHHPDVVAVPLFVVGVLVAAVDARFTRLALNVAIAATLLLAGLVLVSERLHREHDRHGIACPWCTDAIEVEEVRA